MRWTLRFPITLLALVVVAVLATASPAWQGTQSADAAGPGGALQNRQAFHDEMRKLWEDHITWTRMFIVSFAAGLDDSDETATRLLQNQTDIGQAIAPFYGADAGAQLTGLLEVHILTAVDILVAAKAGDQVALDAAIAAWYANAHDIAVFLNTANPNNWPLEEMEAMLVAHLDLTLVEATARLNGDFTADIRAYDEVHVQALEMADMLSDGIIAQFPQAFGIPQ
jgi:hypothetical protein